MGAHRGLSSGGLPWTGEVRWLNPILSFLLSTILKGLHVLICGKGLEQGLSSVPRSSVSPCSFSLK